MSPPAPALARRGPIPPPSSAPHMDQDREMDDSAHTGIAAGQRPRSSIFPWVDRSCGESWRVAFLQYRRLLARYYFTGLEVTMKQLVILFVLTLAGLAVCARVDVSGSESTQKEATMTARGTFDVKVTQQPQDDSAGGPFGRLFLDKQF